VRPKPSVRGANSILEFLRERFSLSPWQTLALIFAGSFILQASALKAPFFADDYVFLDLVSFKSLAQSVISPDPLSSYFRPLGRQVYFWLNAHISNESPVFFHSVNFCLFLLSLALLFSIGKRLSSQLAGAVAAGFLALHYAVDLPLRWVAGSQDLLAMTGALLAIRFFLMRRPWLAALALFLALLCKEIVVFTPLIAILLGRWDGETWKRAAFRTLPLFLILIPWAILWHSFGSRHVTTGVELSLKASGFPAAFVQLARVTFGLEWPNGQFVSRWLVAPPILALLPIVIAVLWTSSPRSKTSHSLTPGLGWALLGALPVAAVATIWSAYYYVFALAGIALALGVWVTKFPRWVAVVLIVILAWTSQGARRINQFATSPDAWSQQSHLNSWWFNRGADCVESYLHDLKKARPTVPGGSTFFFFNIPPFTFWHSGSIVRWVYRDSSLHAYFLREFSLERASNGPNFYFFGQKNRLVELPASEALYDVAAIMVLRDDPGRARDALLLELESSPRGGIATYWLAWVKWTLGDTTQAQDLLKRTGLALNRGPSPELFHARALARSGETQKAIDIVLDAIQRHALDPAPQGLLADLLDVRGGPANKSNPDLVIAAYAARILDPQNPEAWRRWALLQYSRGLFPETRKSLETYFALGGPKAEGDEQARRVLSTIPRLMPGGDLVQKAVRGASPE